MMSLVGDGLDFTIQWDVVYRPSGDQYDFTIIHNEAVTKRRVLYRGKPLVITDDPFGIIIDEVSPIGKESQQGAVE